jgi:lysyl-tRNA synthetase class 2
VIAEEAEEAVEAEDERGAGTVAAAAAAAGPRPPAERLGRRALAWMTAIGGLLYLLPLLPALHDRLGILEAALLPRPAEVAGHVASVLGGVCLILVAPQLARGKERAWMVACAIFAAGAVVHLLKGPHPLLLLYSAAAAVALLARREAFRAPGDPRSLLGVVRFVPAYLALVLVFGFISLLAERTRVEPPLSLGGMFETVLGGLVGLDGPYTYESRLFADVFPAALLALGIGGLVAASVMVFRTVAQRAEPDPRDRARARELVRAYGSDTLAYFALRDDKSYFFGGDGHAMIAYTYASGYALVAADPIGAPGSTDAALEEFLDFCRERAWHVAFLGVREQDLPLYRREGFTGVYLGDEAIIRCDTFGLDAPGMKPVRSAVKRVARAHRFELLRESDASPRLCEDLNAIRERWRGKAPERGFTMELGQTVRGEQPDFLLAVAFDADERPVGFLRLVPCYGPDPGYSLDLMQRDPDAANGMTEFLIANAALALGERGFRRLSMNFAAWGRLFDAGAELTPGQRLQKRVAEVLNPFFQVKSLRDFNEKFHPEWLPRSIVIEDPAAMAKVGLLYASVEGFLDLPVLGRYLVPPPVPAAGRAAPAGGTPIPRPATA